MSVCRNDRGAVGILLWKFTRKSWTVGLAYAVELAGKEDEAIRELRIADTAQLIADLRRRSARS